MNNEDRLKIKPGMLVSIHEKIKEVSAKGEEKERIQIFEGLVIAKHRKAGPSATITVRKISEGVGVEKIFPLFSPIIDKIDILREYKVRRAKLYYLRSYKKKLREKR